VDSQSDPVGNHLHASPATPTRGQAPEVDRARYRSRRMEGRLACLLLTVLGSAQEPAFGSVDAVPAPAESIQLGTDLRLELVGGDVLVVRGAERLTVARTAPTGCVHAITRDENGTVFAGAENGLFVLDDRHLVLDPADVRDGVPPGAIRGVFADGKGRLWLCTDTAFAAMDVSFCFGRTFGAVDGVPAPPFRGVCDGGSGRVLLSTAAGVFAYTPDRGECPRARGGVVREELVASTTGTAAVRLGVDALGGATLRQRRRHHHLLEPLNGDTLRGLQPGTHVVEVHAVDRDLRRQLVAEYTVQVPLPLMLAPRVLPAVAAAAALLLFVLAFRTFDPRASLSRRIASSAGRAALLGVVALQLLAACLGYGRAWPFIGFSMYTETYRENSVLYRPHIVALRADGSRCPIDEAGVLQDGSWQMLAETLHGGDRACCEFLDHLDRCCVPGEAPFAGFLVGDGRIRLTADGPVDVAPTILVRWLR